MGSGDARWQLWQSGEQQSERGLPEQPQPLQQDKINAAVRSDDATTAASERNFGVMNAAEAVQAGQDHADHSQAVQQSSTMCKGASKKLLVLSVGLAGVGKSSILRQVSKMLPGCLYLDKDVINQALMKGQCGGYFSEYYNKYVRRQTYEVMFGIAEDALGGGLCEVAVLDGQFGDKLGESYIREHLEGGFGAGEGAAAVQEERAQQVVVQAAPREGGEVESCKEPQQHKQEEEDVLQQPKKQQQQQQPKKQQKQENGREEGLGDAESRQAQMILGSERQEQQQQQHGGWCWTVVVLVFECSAEEQLQRLKARGELRDEAKYICFESYREAELRKQEKQLQQLPEGVLVIRVDTGRSSGGGGEGCVQGCAELICKELNGYRQA